MHVDDNQIVPATSQFLWFKASTKSQRIKQNKSAKLNVENGSAIKTDINLKECLKNAENVRQQLQLFRNL